MRSRRSAGRTGPFVLFPAWVLTDPGWRRTQPDARAIIIDMSLRWHGRAAEFNNNGRIGYGCRAAELIGICKSSAAQRLAELVASGDWVRLRRESGFSDKRLTREYELTFFPTPRRPPARQDPTKKQRRIKLPHALLTSPAYRGLSSSAKVVLIELIRRYNGSNNGRIGYGVDQGGQIGLSRDVTRRAINELVTAGFIVEAQQPKPGRGGKPRGWGLTMYKADEKTPSHPCMAEPMANSPGG